jgi:biotin transport system substrate-specific component
MTSVSSVPARSRIHSLTLIALSVALIAVCSWIAVPTTIPFTLQTFAVFAILGLLGGRLGTAAIVSYLVMGLVGLPVFSGFSSGPAALFGTTGGYLIGFLFMGLSYWLLTYLFGNQLPLVGLFLLVGLLLLYGFGSAWFLWVYLGSGKAASFLAVLGWCVFPFVLPDLLKLALALMVVRRLRPIVSP